MTLAKEKSLLAANCPESVSKEELYAFYAPLASYCAALCTLSEDERKCVVSNVLAELYGYENDRQEFGTLLLRDIIRRQIHLFCKDKSESELLADDEWENILHEYQYKYRFDSAISELKQKVPTEIFVAFEMFVIHKRSARETADFLDLSVSAVYSAKSRCISLLKELTGGSEKNPDIPHYTREELDLYRHNQMSALSAFNCSAHLSRCKECTAVMEELEEDDCFIADLCGSVQFFREFSKNIEKI